MLLCHERSARHTGEETTQESGNHSPIVISPSLYLWSQRGMMLLTNVMTCLLENIHTVTEILAYIFRYDGMKWDWVEKGRRRTQPTNSCVKRVPGLEGTTTDAFNREGALFMAEEVTRANNKVGEDRIGSFERVDGMIKKLEGQPSSHQPRYLLVSMSQCAC